MKQIYKNRLLIVDGHNLLFQMFFGMPARIVGKNGKAIQGTLGFVGALLKIIRRVTPTHIVVLFDGEQYNPRNEIYSDYKANRVDYSEVSEYDNPFSQLDDIYKALDILEIKHCETTVCETDDVIAAYAFRYGVENEIIISSFDSDFFQLINNNVKVLRYRGDSTIIYDKALFFEKFGILPEHYADYKSLTGDSADNIKGVHGVGPKTAASLINQFGDLENLISNYEKIEKPSVKAAVSENADLIRRNLSLIKLNGCADMPYCFDELYYEYTGITTNEVLTKIGLK